MTYARALLCLVIVSLAQTACERGGVRSREVPKGVERVPAASDTTPEEAHAATNRESDPGRPWTVPDGWTEDPQQRRMRLATYIAPDPAGPVEVAVTRFAGRVGGELANVNRWRGQLGQPPIGEEALGTAIERFASPGYEGYEARIAGDGGVMLAAGVYQAAIDQTWFVRATVADAAAADRLEADVFALARSIAGADRAGGG